MQLRDKFLYLVYIGHFVTAAAACQRGVAGKNDTPVDPGHIQVLIERLSSNDYESREQADAELREIGVPSLDDLSQSYAQTDDFETRLRIQRIAEQIYFWDRVLGHNGFLGIQHRPYAVRGDSRVPEGKAAFEIARVIPGTSADRAGLQDGDLIISIDGVMLPASADATAFADQIRHKRPGTRITLELYRGATFRTMDVLIGHRPQEFYGGSATPELNKQYADAVERFPEWWAREFGTEPFPEAQEYLPLIDESMNPLHPAREGSENSSPSDDDGG